MGYVQNISWRNTTIMERTNNIIHIPNSRLSSAIIKNFDSKNNFKIVGMGVGQELVKSIANKNKWDYSSLNSFININYDKNITNPSDLAPSYLLSRLLKDYHE